MKRIGVCRSGFDAKEIEGKGWSRIFILNPAV
jgi:hypothetical protein